MSYNYRLSPRAQAHFRESTSWYYERNQQVANDFANYVEECIRVICNNVFVKRHSHKKFEHYFLKKYPYTIIYTVDEAKKLVIVRAIYHQKRNPRNKYR